MNAKHTAKPDAFAVLTDRLDADAARDWEALLRENPAEAEDFAELEAAWAALGLLAPAEAPPPSAFNGVLARLPEQKQRTWLPWTCALGGLAAGLAAMWLLQPSIEPAGRADSVLAQDKVSAALAENAEAEAALTEAQRVQLAELEAAQARQAQAMQALSVDNELLRDLLERYQADQEALERQLRVQAQRWASFYDDSSGVSRWSVLSLSASADAATTDSQTSIASRLNQVASTNQLRTQSSGSFTSVDGVGGIATLSGQVAWMEGGSPVTVDSTTDAQSAPERVPTALVLWDASAQEGVLAISGLLAAPEGQDYQMWVDDGVTVRNAGLLPTFDQGTGQAVFNLDTVQTDIGSVFITLEPKGGNFAPEGTVVLKGPVAIAQASE